MEAKAPVEAHSKKGSAARSQRPRRESSPPEARMPAEKTPLQPATPEEALREAAQWASQAHKVFASAVLASRRTDDRYPALARGVDTLVIPRPYSDQFLANLETLSRNLERLALLNSAASREVADALQKVLNP